MTKFLTKLTIFRRHSMIKIMIHNGNNKNNNDELLFYVIFKWVFKLMKLKLMAYWQTRVSNYGWTLKIIKNHKNKDNLGFYFCIGEKCLDQMMSSHSTDLPNLRQIC